MPSSRVGLKAIEDRLLALELKTERAREYRFWLSDVQEMCQFDGSPEELISLFVHFNCAVEVEMHFWRHFNFAVFFNSIAKPRNFHAAKFACNKVVP